MRFVAHSRQRAAEDLRVGGDPGRIEPHLVDRCAGPLHVELRVDAAVVLRCRQRGNLEGRADPLKVEIANLSLGRVGQALQARRAAGEMHVIPHGGHRSPEHPGVGCDAGRVHASDGAGRSAPLYIKRGVD